MSISIRGGGAPTLHPGMTSSSASSSGQAQSLGQQVKSALFAKAPPKVLDPSRFPQLAKTMAKLGRVRSKLATMLGDQPDEYEIHLADGTIGMIDAEGRIFFGAKFLEEYGSEDAVLIGVLAHEMGHRPKRWGEYMESPPKTKEDLEALCRHEETRADIFCAKALAELGLSVEPLVEFLEKIQTTPHPCYFDAKTRGEVMKETFAERSYSLGQRRKLFPNMERMTSPAGHLGEG